MDEYIIDQQVENVTAEVGKDGSRKYSEALSVLKSSWSFFRNQLNVEKEESLSESCWFGTDILPKQQVFLNILFLLHPRDPSALRWWVQAYAETLDINEIIPRAEIAVCNPNVAISATEHLCDALIKDGQFERAKEIL